MVKRLKKIKKLIWENSIENDSEEDGTGVSVYQKPHPYAPMDRICCLSGMSSVF